MPIILGIAEVDFNETLKSESKKLGFSVLFKYPIDPRVLHKTIVPLFD